jgi:hypothetical protein
MIEVKGNIFKSEVEYICVTTNGVLNNKGQAVMGAGVAKQALSLYPGLNEELGVLINKYGNHVMRIREYNGKVRSGIISFPTKHDWKKNSNIDLIERSANELLVILERSRDYKFALPRPGCNNGGLLWVDVKPVISFLPDNLFIIDLED